MSFKPPLIIGLTGLAGSGKDTVADHLVTRHGFARHAIADPIKNMLEELLIYAGIDPMCLHARQMKEQPLDLLGVSPREMMQTLGTEWGRNLHPEFWLRIAALQLGLHDLPRSIPRADRIVLTDLRFHNEAHWVRKLGGFVVRVSRPAPEVRSHQSERGINNIVVWSEIKNHGSLNELHGLIDQTMTQIEALT